MRNPTVREQLQTRFPKADFDFVMNPNGLSMEVLWENPTPSNAAVSGYLRALGLQTVHNDSVPGQVRVNAPQSQGSSPYPQGDAPTRPPHASPGPQPPNPPRRSSPPPAPVRAARPPAASFGSHGLWSVSDLEVLRTTAERWVETLTTRNTVTYYTTGMFLLAGATAYLTWTLDVHPSLLFGHHLAAQLVEVAEWFSPQWLAVVILLLSVVPNLLEFFASGLAAHGNVIVDIAIKAALLFDAATDAPMAFSIAQAFVGYFAPEATFWSQAATVILALPTLLLATVVAEILFLTFVIAFVLLVRRWFTVGRTPQRSGRGHVR